MARMYKRRANGRFAPTGSAVRAKAAAGHTTWARGRHQAATGRSAHIYTYRPKSQTTRGRRARRK